MVVYKSKESDVEVPEHVTVWEWLFELEETSPLYARSSKPLGAYIDAVTEERLDWAQVKDKCTTLSTCLIQQYDLCPGDTVSIFSSNTIWYPVCMLAVSRAGGRVNGAPPAFTVDEMAYTLRVAKSKIVITLPSSLDKALAAAKQVGLPTSHVLLVQGAVDGFKSIQDLIRQGAELNHVPAYGLPTGTTNKTLCGFLNLSSGTTGLPKAVMISHHNVIAQCYIMRQIQIDPDKYKLLAIMPLYHSECPRFIWCMVCRNSSKSLVWWLNHSLPATLCDQDVQSALIYSHTYSSSVTGTWRFCLYPIFLNGDAVMLPTFTIPGMLKATVRFQIEELVLVPPILLRLTRDAVVSEYDIRCVKRWTSGAAPISSEILKALQARFPWTGFRQGYGATEAAVVSAHPPTHWDYKYGEAVGMLVPNTLAKIVDRTGQELGPNQTGEILIKGPQVAMGYLDNEKATIQSFDADGFYRTGDAGYVDKEGLIYIKDRIKEMIKVKGSQVPPAELEDLLLGHDDVDDCAVISIPDEYAGELPKAYVVLKSEVPWNDVSGRRLLDYVRKNKVRYKWLVEVEFVDKIPKSPAGKLLRRVLKEREIARARGEPLAAGVGEGFRVQA